MNANIRHFAKFSKFNRATFFHAALAGCALLIGFFTRHEISLHGFPDGRITEFEAAVSVPLTSLSWCLIGVSALSLYFAIRSKKPAHIDSRLIFAVSILVVLATLVAVPWYFGSYLGLDNGAGG